MRRDGLNDDEGEVMDALLDAVGAFEDLDRQHPQEWEEFIAGIHICQRLLALRIVRRHYSEDWPSHAV